MPKFGGIVHRLSLLAILLVLSVSSFTQPLSTPYSPNYQDTTIIAFLSDIERMTAVSLTYSTSQFDAYQRVQLPTQSLSVEVALRYILANYEIELIERSNNKVILSVLSNTENQSNFNVKGSISDKGSGEKLYGAAIFHMGNNRGSFSNEDGFYSLSNIKMGDVLRVSYIGYSDIFVTVEDAEMDMSLSPNLEVSTIIITEIHSELINPDTGGDIIDLNNPNAKVNILGEKDLLHMARQKPGVYSGSEGLGGLIVRGGSQDQNLMLFEDVPMYSVNHMADISSIFMEDAIRDAQLIRGGFPSRFSGRLSSVLDVHMKEGNQEAIGGSVSAGLPGIRAFLEGPLSEKSSFIIGGRVSWINAYIDPVFNKYSVFDNIDLDFHDFIGKFTYRFSNTSKLSISAYSGGDQVQLDKNQIMVNQDGSSFNSIESTSFGWDNNLMSINYSGVMSDKWYLSSNLGILEYEYRSKASYDFTSIINQEVVDNDKRAVVTNSGIVNILGGVNLDYFASDKHKLKMGFGINQHRFSPKVEQSLTDVNIDNPEIDADSITVGNEYTLYLEDTYSPNTKSQVYFGINLTRFGVRNTSFNYLQPRFKLSLQPKRGIQVEFSGSRMVQFVHLLVNNGLGLPSDLWVPSTDEIAPEVSDQLSMSVRTDIDRSTKLTIGGFLKKQQNVILYRDPQDLYSAILNDANSQANFITDREWERRIETGKRDIFGLEISAEKSVGDWQYNISYTKSRAVNRFDNLNRGNAFTDRYDRPHDINLSFSYQIGSKWNVGLQWIYGSGTTFTLPLVEVPTTIGVTVVTQDELNNYRMPAYHHLDLLAKYDNTSSGHGLKASFGIYNVYNRFNPYYIYIYTNNVSEKRVFKKLSLFPFLPHFNVTYGF